MRFLTLTVGAWFAHVTFWILVVYGGISAELRLRRLVIVLLLWLAGFFARPYVTGGGALFTGYVAILDVALVLMIFKSDLPLSGRW